MPLVIGGPYKGGFFGGANVDISASGTLTDAPQTVPDIIVRAGGGQDYTTIQAAVSAATSGDIIEVWSDTPGGSQTFAEAVTLLGAVNGTQGNPCILRGKSGDTILVTAPTSTITMNVNSVDWWEVENFTIGDESQWTPQDPVDPNGGYTPSLQLQITGTCNNIVCRDLIVTGANSGTFPNWLRGLNCSFYNCKFWKHGTNFDQRTPTPGDTGDLCVASGKYAYWEGCQFRLGGHDAMVVRAPWQRFVDCIFDNNEWVSVHGDTDYPGARALNILTSETDTSGTESPWGRVSLRGCELTNPGPGQNDGGGQVPGGGRTIDAEGKYISLYDCILYEDAATAGQTNGVFGHSYPNADPAYTDNWYVHHNVVWGGAHLYDGNDSGRSNTGQASDDSLITGGPMFYKNNIAANLSSVNGIESRWGGYAQRTEVENFFTGVNGWMDHYHGSNIFDASGTVEVGMEYPNGTAVDRTLANAEIDWPAHFSNNQDTTPDFVDETLRTRVGFQLNSGAGIGQAEALTTTVGSGSGTSVTLNDANYFFARAAYGITDTNADNDWIKIGTTAVVEITDINYTTGVVTIASSRSWGSSDDVFLVARDQSTVIDDIGIGPA